MNPKNSFDERPISTQTLIISTNIKIDCKVLFETTEWVPVKEPSPGKTRMVVHPDDLHLPDGTIVFLQEGISHKGVIFKKPSKKYFLNSVTIVMKIDTKYINIKVSNKGKLQITGCSKDEYAFRILDCFWSRIKERKDIWQYHDHHDPSVTYTNFEAIVIPVMCNINFAVDFQINREALDTIIKTKTEYRSILEPSDGYVGVNIKIITEEESLEDVTIDKYTYTLQENAVFKTQIKFVDYLQTLPPKEQKKKVSKCLVNTFLVFYSGKVIMSGGISRINRRKAYEIFMELLKEHKEVIVLKE